MSSISICKYVPSAYRLIYPFKHKLLVKQQQLKPKSTLLSTLYILMQLSLTCDMKVNSFPVSLTQSNGVWSCSFSTPLNDLLQWRWVLCVQQCHLLAQFLWERELAEYYKKKAPVWGKQKLRLHNKSRIFPSPLHLPLGSNCSRRLKRSRQCSVGADSMQCASEAHREWRFTQTQKRSTGAEDRDMFKTHQEPGRKGKQSNKANFACPWENALVSANISRIWFILLLCSQPEKSILSNSRDWKHVLFMFRK